MPRDSRVYLEDILGAIGKIKRYTEGLSKQAFAGDEKTLDAVVRNLEVIGEAVKRLPAELRAREPGIDWAKIGGLRDVLIHQYFGIDVDILWDIIKNKLPALEVSVSALLREPDRPR
jgi:uncharacterized protein with HEPN domain